MAGEQTRVLPFWHSMINKGLTLVSNMFCNLNLTDMETCYKVFRTDLLKSIPIRSDRFGFEPEIVMKSAKRKLRIYEVPISYHGRTYEEGKKIGWKDGVKALGVILRFWADGRSVCGAVRPRRAQQSHRNAAVPELAGARAAAIHVGDAVLEVGAGIGNIAGRLMGKRALYVAAEKDPLHLHALRNRFLRTPNVMVQRLDPGTPEDLAGLGRQFDTMHLPERAGVSEGPRGLAGRHAGRAEAGRQYRAAGPQWPGALRRARPQPRPSAPLRSGGSAWAAANPGLRDRADPRVQQSRHGRPGGLTAGCWAPPALISRF